MAGSYTLESGNAIVKEKSTNRWSEVDVGEMTMEALFSAYKKIEVGVLDFYGEKKTVDLYAYESALSNRDWTVGQWLGLLGNTALALTDGLPTLSFSYVNYVPVNYHKTIVQGAKSGYHPSQSVESDFDDIILTFEELDSRLITDYCLFSFNG